MKTYWINVDKPTRLCVVHSEVCRYARGKRETPFKGVERIKRDGGWMPFPSTQEARNYFDENWLPLGYEFSLCQFCLKGREAAGRGSKVPANRKEVRGE